MKYFYNTVDLTGIGLLEAEEGARKQEAEILNIFKLFSEYAFRAYDIEQLLIRNCFEINHDSAKRAITNLCKKGLLIRSEKAACPGPYGIKVNVWQYNGQINEQETAA